MKILLSLFATLLLSFASLAQERERDPLIPEDVPLTWLGVDFTQTRFLGDVPMVKGVEISAAEVRDKYAPAINQLFVDEMRKYNVAKYTHRKSVGYALEVTGKANKKIDDSFFSSDSQDFERLQVSDISKLVSEYDFQGRKGLGLMFFVEGMNKTKLESAAWITVVDMDQNSLVATRRKIGKGGGAGFRNTWANSFVKLLIEAGK